MPSSKMLEGTVFNRMDTDIVRLMKKSGNATVTLMCIMNSNKVFPPFGGFRYKRNISELLHVMRDVLKGI